MVAKLNIEHFRELLKEETDEAKRLLIVRLLEEEEAKLKMLNAAETERKRPAVQ